MAIDDSLERARLHPDVLKNLNKNKKLKTAEAYSEDNPPPYPVTSVNGQTGDVDIPTVNLPVSVQNGGTGETTAAQAAKNLGVLPLGEVVTKIPSNADLDNYGLPGVYAVNNNDIARTIANMPEGYAGTLRVFSGLGADITASSTYKYIIQEYVAYYGRTYYRYGDSGSGTTLTWGVWRTVYDSRDFPLSVTMGGTGASSAAAARENLAVPNMQTDTHPTLLKSDGSNSWIKIGKANSSYGLLPSQVGAKGSGHNHIGTAQWYWSDAYVDNYYGSWKGDTIPVGKGGTGATTAAAARTNLGVPSKTSQLTNDSKYTTLLDVYPVGSIYMSVNSTSPATLFGGTWEQLKDRFLLAAGSTYSAGSTGGSSTMAHTHTMSHTHNLDSNGYAKMTLYGSGGVSYKEKNGVTTWTANYRVTGGGGVGGSVSINSTDGAELGGRTAGSSAANTGAASNTDNMPPYLTVYMWKRTK